MPTKNRSHAFLRLLPSTGETVTDALDKIHTTAASHHRVMVVEVMGRDSGWIAAYSGIGGGADVILVPEVPFDIDQVAEIIRQRHERGRYFSIVVAAEGAKFAGGVETHDGNVLQEAGRDEFGHLRLGGIGEALAREIDEFEETICSIGVAAPIWFRAPAGFKNPFLHPILAARGLELVGWSARALSAYSRVAARSPRFD